MKAASAVSSSSSQSKLPPLIITFESEVCEVGPGQSLTFGRAGDLVIDPSNRLLHRVFGRFSDQDGQWWLANEGRSAAILVTDQQSASYTRVVAGASLPLPFADALISFSAGRANYRLRSQTSAIDTSGAGSETVLPGGSATLTTGALVFNDEQFELLVALSRNRLDGPITIADLPANRELAHALGWTITKFNRKLDNLCAKLTRAGVAGLQGSVADVAQDRRVQLANFAVEQGIVAASDLS